MLTTRTTRFDSILVGDRVSPWAHWTGVAGNLPQSEALGSRLLEKEFQIIYEPYLPCATRNLRGERTTVTTMTILGLSAIETVVAPNHLRKQVKSMEIEESLKSHIMKLSACAGISAFRARKLPRSYK